jgi:hypothetical protein
MKQLVSVSLALMMFVTTTSRAQRRSDDGPVVISLPQGFDTTSCQLKYFLVGSFGLYGGFVQPTLQISAYEVETVHEGVAVEKLKAILYCSGHHIETIAFDSLRDVTPWRAQLQPRSIDTVPFSGTVRGLPAQNGPVLNVEVSYVPWWTCEFVHLVDCNLGGWTIVTTPLTPGNGFSVELPDFARDAVVLSFKNHGEFTFRILQGKTGNVLYELNPTGDTSRLSGIPVAGAYPSEVTFKQGFADRQAIIELKPTRPSVPRSAA